MKIEFVNLICNFWRACYRWSKLCICLINHYSLNILQLMKHFRERDLSLLHCKMWCAQSFLRGYKAHFVSFPLTLGNSCCKTNDVQCSEDKWQGFLLSLCDVLVNCYFWWCMCVARYLLTYFPTSLFLAVFGGTYHVVLFLNSFCMLCFKFLLLCAELRICKGGNAVYTLMHWFHPQVSWCSVLFLIVPMQASFLWAFEHMVLHI